MKKKGQLINILLMSLLLSNHEVGVAQERRQTDSLPPLPDPVGRAGMYAGVSHGKLLCMGGANFEATMPWQDGVKTWHDDIFVFDEEEGDWQILAHAMPDAIGYGVSVTYDEKVWLVGGSNSVEHLSTLWSAEYCGGQIRWVKGPSLPTSVANMSGSIVGSLLIVVGGMETNTSMPLKVCYGIDLEDIEQGWISLPSWPGPERIFPVCGVTDKKLYMFSGENSTENAKGIKHRHILQDAYSFEPRKTASGWDGKWTKLTDIPRGMSAGANPAPLLSDGRFKLWGGVDRITALHKDPATHPGMPKTVLLYAPETDSWEYDSANSTSQGRVTLPTAVFRDKVYYISGEVKPGIRENSIVPAE